MEMEGDGLVKRGEESSCRLVWRFAHFHPAGISPTSL
jgi:hypothetical protein